MRRAPGFTLIELIMAVFILAMSVTILMGTQSTSMRLMGYANNTAVVTMLTRAKMQDLEYEVQATIKEEGLSEEFVQTLDGDFSEQGYPEIYWEALIQSIEIDDNAANNFVESVTNQLYGSGDEEGSLSGNLAITQFLPVMIGYFPVIINQLGQRIRKITLTTTWDYLGVEQTLTVSQFITVLEVDAASGVSGSSVTATGKEDELDGTATDNSDKSNATSTARPTGGARGNSGEGRDRNTAGNRSGSGSKVQRPSAVSGSQSSNSGRASK